MSTKRTFVTKTLPKYRENPSVTHVNATLSVKRKKVFSKDHSQALIITDVNTGEVRPAVAGATFIKEEVVDTERFIKLYLGGVLGLEQLTATGFNMFKIIYRMMIDNPGQDRLVIDYDELYDKQLFTKTRKTFQRGIYELLKSEAIYQTIASNVYFLNMALFFCGDRVTHINSYKLATKGSAKTQSLVEIMTNDKVPDPVLDQQSIFDGEQ